MIDDLISSIRIRRGGYYFLLFVLVRLLFEDGVFILLGS